jgi:hypothetical protein
LHDSLSLVLGDEASIFSFDLLPFPHFVHFALDLLDSTGKDLNLGLLDSKAFLYAFNGFLCLFLELAGFIELFGEVLHVCYLRFKRFKLTFEALLGFMLGSTLDSEGLLLKVFPLKTEQKLVVLV